MSNLENINWLHAMGLESVDLASDVPFDFHKERNIVLAPKKIEKPNLVAPSLKIVIKNKHDSSLIADSCSNLEELRLAVINFDGCDLKKTAINTVFSDGNPESQIMLIGEAPGASEDAKGIPFCGESGILLDNIFKAINMSRDRNLYITNSVFWRPPANRRPTNEEIEICKPFLEKHIALINPKLIVLVGSTAVAAVLGSHFKISDMRGKFLTYQNAYMPHKIDLTSIFHPAYLLRQPSQKKETWYDILKIRNYFKG
jgi:uracil-DNA glycosylase family 4